MCICSIQLGQQAAEAMVVLSWSEDPGIKGRSISVGHASPTVSFVFVLYISFHIVGFVRNFHLSSAKRTHFWLHVSIGRQTEIQTGKGRSEEHVILHGNLMAVHTHHRLSHGGWCWDSGIGWE